MKEDLKKVFERLTWIACPRPKDIALHARKPRIFKFEDDGETPNNMRCPLIVYKSAVKLAKSYDRAAIFEAVFGSHGWKDSWRDGMYDFNHFHTKTHEVLGVARGSLTALFGGTHGRKIELKAGDVVAIPAGTGHRCLRKSNDLLIVGSYPSNGGKYDEPKPEDAPGDARKSIQKVRAPLSDPVYGRAGALPRLWRK
ncbi:MAG TPA: hypothetical protein VGH23_18065 [Rhizomicrobium sp.]|jgi:uncharacterized protein YjlB